jgi:hypothetical protein
MHSTAILRDVHRKATATDKIRDTRSNVLDHRDIIASRFDNEMVQMERTPQFCLGNYESCVDVPID